MGEEMTQTLYAHMNKRKKITKAKWLGVEHVSTSRAPVWQGQTPVLSSPLKKLCIKHVNKYTHIRKCKVKLP
jgi:hypothetical protein